MMGLLRGLVTVFVVLQSVAVAAQAPLSSPRPTLRPVSLEAKLSKTQAPFFSPRPKMRPALHRRSKTSEAVEKAVVEQTITEDMTVRRVKASTARAGTTTSLYAIARSVRPKARPKGLRVAVLEKRKKTRREAPPVKYKKTGSVCGVRGIRGYGVAPVRGKIRGCGISNPVKINELDGVKLTREILVGCNSAKAMYSWVQKSAKPVVGRKGGGLAKIKTIAGYSCRNRNSAKSGKLSEHAKGNAVDIAGFVLKNGEEMTVLRGWRTKSYGPTLKKLHKTACGPFRTVLGPNANRFHQDHFHFDVGKHRGGGTYCR